jgi:hypothetical protein
LSGNINFEGIDMLVLPAVFITLATLFVMAIMGQQ